MKERNLLSALFLYRKRRIFDIIKLWGLNEHSNGLLRRDGLPTDDFFVY